MPPDPLHHPIAILTDHRILTDDEEAALLATLRAGVAARARLQDAAPATHAALHQQVSHAEEARTTLFRHNLRLVVSIAKRYLPMAGDQLSLEDLISFGSIGLLHGIDRFDPTKSRKLSTYATWWIRQAIGRGIADEGRIIGLPVHVHERLNRQRTVRTRLTHDLGREPSREELAAALAISLPQLAHLERIQQDVSSLNVKVRHTDNPTELGDLIPDQRGDSEAEVIAASVRRDLAEAMQRRLTDREQRFVRAYFGSLHEPSRPDRAKPHGGHPLLRDRRWPHLADQHPATQSRPDQRIH